MTKGSPTISSGASLAINGGGIVFFTEDIQRTLHIALMRKAAMASGIDAIAARAIDSGDIDDSLNKIQALAAMLSSELDTLANIAGQIAATPSA